MGRIFNFYPVRKIFWATDLGSSRIFLCGWPARIFARASRFRTLGLARCP